MLYSTYIYFLKALKRTLPEARVETIPGVTAFGAAAALADFPIGASKAPVSIVPTSEDLSTVENALATGGTVILMKIGKRLGPILDLLDRAGCIDRGVLVSRAGLAGQRVETDLRALQGEAAEGAGNLSVILIHADAGGER